MLYNISIPPTLSPRPIDSIHNEGCRWAAFGY